MSYKGHPTPSDTKSLWYDVFDQDKLVISIQDQKAAERRVFAENCSYIKKSDQVWHMKVRESHIITQ